MHGGIHVEYYRMVATDQCISLQLQLWLYRYFVVLMLTYNTGTGDLQTQS